MEMEHVRAVTILNITVLYVIRNVNVSVESVMMILLDLVIANQEHVKNVSRE